MMMKTFLEFLEESSKVIDIANVLVHRLIKHHHNMLSPKGYVHSVVQKGIRTTYAWRKGDHHFEIMHKSTDPNWYQWGHAKVGKNGKLDFYNSGQEPLRGDPATGAPDFRRIK